MERLAEIIGLVQLAARRVHPASRIAISAANNRKAEQRAAVKGTTADNFKSITNSTAFRGALVESLAEIIENMSTAERFVLSKHLRERNE